MSEHECCQAQTEDFGGAVAEIVRASAHPRRQSDLQRLRRASSDILKECWRRRPLLPRAEPDRPAQDLDQYFDYARLTRGACGGRLRCGGDGARA